MSTRLPRLRQIVSVHQKQPPEDPLNVGRVPIKRKTTAGYSVRQIHDTIGAPESGPTVSVRARQRFIIEHGPAGADAK